MRDDTRGKHPGSLAATTIVSFANQVGYVQGAGELEAAASIQRLAVSCLDRASLAQARPKFPVAAERELRTLAQALDALMSGQIMTAIRASTAAFFSFCSNARYSKPHTATEMDFRLCEFVQHACDIPADALSLMLYVGSSKAVSDYYGHGAKMNCRYELIPCRSFFLLAMVGAALEENANRNVALDRFSRSLENQ